MFGLTKGNGATESTPPAPTEFTARIRLLFDVEQACSGGQNHVNVYSRPQKCSEKKSLLIRTQLAFQEAVNPDDIRGFSVTLQADAEERYTIVQEADSNARLNDGTKVPATIASFGLFEMVQSG